MAVASRALNRTFDQLVACAIAGERCPQGQPHGPLHKEAPAALAKAGRIRIDIFRGNWRVVTIMDGEHKGKQTQPPPWTGARPYKVIYKDHVAIRA